jgi:hypothetical protein
MTKEKLTANLFVGPVWASEKIYEKVGFFLMRAANQEAVPLSWSAASATETRHSYL